MVKVDHFVTEWGLPAVRWHDRIKRMIRTEEVERWLWIHHDGVQVMASAWGKIAVLGRWEEWSNLEVGTMRDELTPYDELLIRSANVQFVEHRTLEAYFGGGPARRLSVSAVSVADMRRLHSAITQIFIAGRANYTPPEDGVCWRNAFVPVVEEVGANEAESLKLLGSTALNVGAAACREMKVASQAPIPAIYWWEPVATPGLMGLGAPRYHKVMRSLWVHREVRPGVRELWFNSQKAGMEGVVVVYADFGLLKDFRVVDSKETNAHALQPLKGTLPGLSIVADFRYGLSLPLTCATFPPGVDGRAKIEALAAQLRALFLPLVGESLSDAEVGL